MSEQCSMCEAVHDKLREVLEKSHHWQLRAEAAEERVAAAEREAERLRHHVAVEGDFVCPDSLALTMTTKLVGELRAALREACDLATRYAVLGSYEAQTVPMFTIIRGVWIADRITELRAIADKVP